MGKIIKFYKDGCEANLTFSYFYGVNSVLLILILCHIIVREISLSLFIFIAIFYNGLMLPYLIIRKSSKTKPY